MASDSLAYVLGLLRRIKSTTSLHLGNAPISFVHLWNSTEDTLATAKLVIAIQENLASAFQFISDSKLTDEAKTGLLETVTSLRYAFSFEQITSAMQSHIKSLDSALTNFAIITSSMDVELPSDAASEISVLISELNEFLEKLDDMPIATNVRFTARRHVLLLIAMLTNAQAVGIEASISAYYDMILALRKESSTQIQQNESKGFWVSLVEWGKRFEVIHGMIERGSKLIPYFNDIPRIGGF